MRTSEYIVDQIKKTKYYKINGHGQKKIDKDLVIGGFSIGASRRPAAAREKSAGTGCI